jgi:spore coat protein CotH
MTASFNITPTGTLDSTPTRTRRRAAHRFRSALVLTTAGLVLFTSCTTSSDAAPLETVVDRSEIVVIGDDGEQLTTSAPTTEVDLFDSSVVHTISVDFDQADFDAMIETFASTGDKDWISATVMIDGTTYADVGLRLKGNSSLFGLTADTSGNPEDLPWLIRLNKFVEGEDHQDYEDIVIRSNSTETALNEAVAQELLALTGLASQDPIATAFTVNGGETELRLAVENPDEEWYEDNFDDECGLLYKADSEGDYSYRGEDNDAYTDVFDQKVGDDDLQPLIDFLDFINNSDDATFASELADQVDVEAFATYLAFQDLIGNADDISGRGNNSFLQYDTSVEQFTVVSWDLNLAFGTANVGGGAAGGGSPPAGSRPAGPPPEGAGGGAGGPGGPGGEANVLVDRFMANAEFAAMYTTNTAELTELLFASGTVGEVIANWSNVLINGAADLVSEATVISEAAALISYVDGGR